MSVFKMYQQLPNGQERLVSVYNSTDDTITAVQGAPASSRHTITPKSPKPATQKAAPKPAPAPRKLTLAAACAKNGLCPGCLRMQANCHCAPAPNIMARVVALQQSRGQRP